jgi:MFS family permease
MSFLAVIVALSRMTFPATQQADGNGSVWERMAEGMKYAHAHNFILSLLAIVAAGSLFGLPYITLLPIFARDILHGGPTELGALMSAGGVGAVLGGLTLAFLGDFSFKGKLLATGSLLFAFSVVGFSLSPDYYLSLAFLLVSGWAMITSVAVINTLLQKLVPGHLRGRVMSMYSLAFLGLMPIGNLFAGVTAQLLGAPWALALGGVVLAAIVLAVVSLKREILTLK